MDLVRASGTVAYAGTAATETAGAAARAASSAVVAQGGVWVVGQRVDARFQAQRYGAQATKWFPAVIRAVHDDGSYDILYNDGDTESRVPSRFVREARQKTAAKRPASAAADDAPAAKRGRVDDGDDDGDAQGASTPPSSSSLRARPPRRAARRQATPCRDTAIRIGTNCQASGFQTAVTARSSHLRRRRHSASASRASHACGGGRWWCADEALRSELRPPPCPPRLPLRTA